MPLTVKPTKLDCVLEWTWIILLVFFVTWWGWSLGICAIVLLWNVYYRAADRLFGLEHLGSSDQFILNASCDEHNHPMIIGALKFERFNAKKFGDQVFSRILKFRRNRSRLTKFLGTWWWKELPLEDIQQDKVIKVVKGIHTEKELAAFMC